MLEKVRAELHDCINRFGLNDARTVQKSQELDKILNDLEVQ